MARSVQVEVIAFRKKKNFFEFLLLRRVPEKGGFWQPITGGLEDSDDSLLSGAYRELLEESGLSKDDVLRVLDNVHYFEIRNHYLTGKPVPLLKEYVFGFEIRPEAEVSISNNYCLEHDSFGWFSFEEALRLLKWDDNKTALKKLNQLLINENYSE